MSHFTIFNGRRQGYIFYRAALCFHLVFFFLSFVPKRVQDVYFRYIGSALREKKIDKKKSNKIMSSKANLKFSTVLVLY